MSIPKWVLFFLVTSVIAGSEGHEVHVSVPSSEAGNMTALGSANNQQ
jgi:hypothetical protein